MKKNFTLLCMGLLAVSASAQQLPNADFEGEWVESCPWNSVSGTKLSMSTAAAQMGSEVFGKQPQSWCVSNVLGVVQESTEMASGYAALGTTEVGAMAEGYESASALKLTNTPNPFMASQIVPAYVTLGTTWATNGLAGFFNVVNKDGGVFGGIEFTNRPDALTFKYKRAYADANSAQLATVLVYSWKGTWTQAEVPANNSMNDQNVKVDMVNRDRNILEMETSQGGEVTRSADAQLIAKGLEYIEGEAADWTDFVAPITYYSTDAPQMLNVVIAANDYFNDTDIKNGNSLTVDNVKFVYYSRLATLRIAGGDIAGFDSNTYAYTSTDAVPTADQVEYELLGQAKGASVDVAVNDNVVTITVKGAGADVDGLDQHVYTVTYAGASAEPTVYSGLLNIKMNGGDLAKDQPAEIFITPAADGKCTISLPNFQLDLGGGAQNLGDIVVPNVATTVAGDVTSYTGHVDGMELLEGNIVADVDLEGTTNAAGEAAMKIKVMWNGIPIDVEFNGKAAAGIDGVAADQAAAEYYTLSGLRVNADTLTPGLYIRRQGTKVTKVLVK